MKETIISIGYSFISVIAFLAMILLFMNTNKKLSDRAFVVVTSVCTLLIDVLSLAVAIAMDNPIAYLCDIGLVIGYTYLTVKQYGKK
jgi:type IV secretory pathway TrbL component